MPTTPAGHAAAESTATSYQKPESNDDAPMREKASDATEQARVKAGEAAHAAREQASEKLDAAQQSVDAQRDTVAGGLDTVATQLRERAEMFPGGDATTHAAQTAARGIESASGYVREHDVNQMMSDLERVVRSHPTESLVVALAAGFLVGRMFKS